jgi:phosphoglucosamine mutase
VGTDIGRRCGTPRRSPATSSTSSAIVDVDLTGLRIVVDGANGAASSVAPQVYRQLGAEVVTVNCRPGRLQHQRAGRLDLPRRRLRRRWSSSYSADAGISHDGDADRLIAATHEGVEVDGDVILAVLARQMHHHGTLRGDAVATTVMTNLGFKQAMQGMGVEVVETRVGDRYVLEAMRERDLNLGGEQSGHLIDLDHATTGDGILSAVRAAVDRALDGGDAQGAVDGHDPPAPGARSTSRASTGGLDDCRRGLGGRPRGGALGSATGSRAAPSVGDRAGDPRHGRGRDEEDAQAAVDRIADAVRDHLTV